MQLHRPTPFAIACHFFVSHIAGATIPASRLSNILDSMYRGRPLTVLSLNYLQQQNLTELHQLATGQITYEAYIAALDPALVAREQAAEAEHQAKEARLAALYQREREATEAARTEGIARQAARVAQDQREREAAEAIRIARVAELAMQCMRNREAAEARWKARMSNPDYIAPTPYDIARHYRVNHIPAAVATPLRNILDDLHQGRPLAPAYLTYLQIHGFSGLYGLAIGETSYEAYISAVDAAEHARIAAEAARLERVEARRLRDEAAEAARIARESDPAYILRKKYGVVDIDQSLSSRMMEVLHHIDSGNRLAEDDFVWLTTTAESHFTEELRKAYHLVEADFCASEYRRTLDPWNAINASGHYRKCDQPDTALQLLSSVPARRLMQPKVQSAMCTTRGGVMRDLGRRNEALQLGQQGHELQPRDFRPCTLLGAIHIELGNYGEGHDWYAKAEERGASKQSIDTELRSIFLRADKARRETMKASLLAVDPNRYRWVNDKKYLST